MVVGTYALAGARAGLAGLGLVGVLRLGVIFNRLDFQGTVDPWWQWVLRGAFLPCVVLVQARLPRRGAAAG